MVSYSDQFKALTKKQRVHDYQVEVAENIFARRHTVIRAPTGAGKTLAVLAPFLLAQDRIKVGGMIYVLPLRTLVESVFEEARTLAQPFGINVAIQTGERADAEFFHDSDIIVTTFDQLLSGLLAAPYGQSKKLWNINAASIAGKLVVFDEFHLMEIDKAFITALVGAQLFKKHCITAWMTATATSPLVNLISKTLDAKEVELSREEETKLFEGRGIQRRLKTHWEKNLTAAEVLQHKGHKTLVVVNTVGRAQALFTEVHESWPALLLHSRFFSSHRRDKQGKLKDAELIIATQVIEAGVDITSNVLLTEASPVNSIVQRAGRCARFENESGTIHVYGVSRPPWPYTDTEIDRAIETVVDTESLTSELCRNWVQEAHGDDDRRSLTGFNGLSAKRIDFIKDQVQGNGNGEVAAFIRKGQDSVRVFILSNPGTTQPQSREALQVRRRTAQRYSSHALSYNEDGWGPWSDAAYAIALHPSIAGYTKEVGLILGSPGMIESPSKPIVERPGWPPISAESWPAHTANVVDHAHRRMRNDGLSEELRDLVIWTAKLHDVGKLQQKWQVWAHERQAARGKIVEFALAHTDYDWHKDKGQPKPPVHALASCLYGADYLKELGVTERMAVLLAILAHHGGKTKSIESPANRPDPLHLTSIEALGQVGMSTPSLLPQRKFSQEAEEILSASFFSLWPTLAILSRILRLADQNATAESNND